MELILFESTYFSVNKYLSSSAKFSDKRIREWEIAAV